MVEISGAAFAQLSNATEHDNCFFPGTGLVGSLDWRADPVPCRSGWFWLDCFCWLDVYIDAALLHATQHHLISSDQTRRTGMPPSSRFSEGGVAFLLPMWVGLLSIHSPAARSAAGYGASTLHRGVDPTTEKNADRPMAIPCWTGIKEAVHTC